MFSMETKSVYSTWAASTVRRCPTFWHGLRLAGPAGGWARVRGPARWKARVRWQMVCRMLGPTLDVTCCPNLSLLSSLWHFPILFLLFNPACAGMRLKGERGSQTPLCGWEFTPFQPLLSAPIFDTAL